MSKFLNLDMLKEIEISSILSKLQLNFDVSSKQLQLLVATGSYDLLLWCWNV